MKNYIIRFAIYRKDKELFSEYVQEDKKTKQEKDYLRIHLAYFIE